MLTSLHRFLELRIARAAVASVALFSILVIISGFDDDLLGFMIVPALFFGTILFCGGSRKVTWLSTAIILAIATYPFWTPTPDPSAELEALLPLMLIPIWIVILLVLALIGQRRLQSFTVKHFLWTTGVVVIGVPVGFIALWSLFWILDGTYYLAENALRQFVFVVSAYLLR